MKKPSPSKVKASDDPSAPAVASKKKPLPNKVKTPDDPSAPAEASKKKPSPSRVKASDDPSAPAVAIKNKPLPNKVKTPDDPSSPAVASKKKPSPRKLKEPVDSGEDLNSGFPIVAIGASAGGLEAFKELLRNLSPHMGMAFIYVQHLSPDHKSMLTSLLANATSMKVQEIKNKTLIVPDTVYIIPPDKELNVAGAHITLSPRPGGTKVHLPIDILFTSLAIAHREHVIGVILSGNASDGTAGMKAIKQEGGLTFAQDETAKFNSMPRSAILADVVDFILSPLQIAKELSLRSRHPFLGKTELLAGKEDFIDNSDPHLKKILQMLHTETGVDFGLYKLKTVERRVIRRMLLYKIDTLEAYSQYLNDKKEEIGILYQDLLIHVTRFFRDTDTYKYLKTVLLPGILKRKTEERTLRIWVPACSTGEESYSIAMIVQELLDKRAVRMPVQIFATDLSADAIQKARVGLYSIEELESVTPKRIQRFFTKSEGGYRVDKSLRDMCVFAPHNVLRDPPFSKLDLISCRNLLIYLSLPAQKKALQVFHFALLSDGYLLLGNAEGVNAYPQLFSEINSTNKVYTRNAQQGYRGLLTTYPIKLTPPDPPARSPKGVEKAASKGTMRNPPQASQSLENIIDAAILAKCVPASVIVNHRMEILQFRGSTDLYLTNPPGKASFNILKMVRPEIAFWLRTAISGAIKSKKPVQKKGLDLNVGGVLHTIRVDVLPLDVEWEEPILLVVFQELEKISHKPVSRKGSKDAPVDDRYKKLESDLAEAQGAALAFSHEQESFIEELQTANEEVVSSNEELQTVNEELETSKEEIESTNEELMTANQELVTRNELLQESYEYSKAIISTLHDPMIVLDRKLQVKTANKAFYTKFGVDEEETEGVLLYELGNNQWNIPLLRQLLEDIIPQNSFFHDFEVRHNFPNLGEKVLILNASRLNQKSHGERLILLSIKDITEAVKLQMIEKEGLKADIKESKTYSQKLKLAVQERTRELKTSNQVLLKQNSELEKLNKELEAFTYLSSHDLQEPLRKIRTFTGRILGQEEQHLSETGKTYFHYIQASAQRMQTLIQDLLHYSLFTTRDGPFVHMDLNEVLEEIKAEFMEQMEEEKASIEVKETCKIRIIPFQFRQLMYNLLHNAFKFARPGVPVMVTITCSTIKLEMKSPLGLKPNVTYSHVSVTDNGIGFEKKYADRIFELFEKLHSKDIYAGTGIGLSIVKKIVDNHQGIIKATSTLQKGTTFDIYIPNS